MAILGKFTKQPVDVLDYQFSFADWLADRADTVVSQTVVSVPLTVGAVNMTISSITRAAGVVNFFASGGVDGVKYEVTCTITTASVPARVKSDSMIITVKAT